ncbi:expressed unknown protein [Seminavis robusta]|uniref:Uncharacterized protein n=1 Tax=Seminavis robusta TaxID=568900 RepID=A0A9N8EFE4_9STRA|nr:expressed unknown protein [Seminavis robusta]|eukprot:Sro998_g229570.1 n/a (266) ;mRNA; r:35259-36056
MMQVPSSNQSHTSRRSNASSTARIGRWFDGLLDKACCAPGYSANDVVMDDNSIAYRDNDNTNSSHRRHRPKNPHQQRRDDSGSVGWDEAEGKIHWLSDIPSCDLGTLTDTRQQTTPQKNRQYNMRFHLNEEPPLSPGSDATATTVLTGSTSCTTPIHNQQKHTRQQPHDKIKTAPMMPTISSSSSKLSYRSHSTGNMRSPEEEWQQVQKQQPERRIPSTKLPKKKQQRAPTEQVVIPEDWAHEHGMRRMWSETLPKLPFQTVQPY